MNVLVNDSGGKKNRGSVEPQYGWRRYLRSSFNAVDVDGVAVGVEAAVDLHVLAFVLLGFGLIIKLIGHVGGCIFQHEAITVLRNLSGEYLGCLLHLALSARRAGSLRISLASARLAGAR